MKQNWRSQTTVPFPTLMRSTIVNRVCAPLLSAVALLAFTTTVHGQGAAPTSNYTNDFNAANSAASWIYWYGLGYNNTAMTWDSTMDAGSGSGSLFYFAVL